MKFTIFIIGILCAVLIFCPVIAESVNNDQTAGGIIEGSDNTMSNTNNIVTNTNLNSDGGNIITYNNGQTLLENNIIIPSSPYSKTLDPGMTQTEIISLFQGEVYIVDNDKTLYGEDRIQRKGEVYKYTVKSSVPVLVYVIDTIDKSKVMCWNGIPVYDWFFQKYDHGGVVTIFPNPKSQQQYNHPSTLQSFNLTLPEDGRYSLVIDTRIEQDRGAQRTTNFDANTLDITFSMQKFVSGYTQSKKSVIGTTSTYKYDKNGHIDISQSDEITY